MSYFNFNNHNIFYKESGKGSPLILIHGDSASSKMFMPELKFYSKNFRVIIIDLIGQGKSERVKDMPLNYWHANAMMLIELCRHLNIKDVNLIGTSGGAIVALNAVLEEAKLFSKVIVDSFMGEELSENFAQFMLADREKSKNKLSSKVFWFLMHGSDWRYVVDQNTDMIKNFAQKRGNFFIKDITNIKNNILITGSRKDDLIPNVESILKSINLKIKNSKLILFDEGNHPAMLSNNKEFRKLVLNFLGK